MYRYRISSPTLTFHVIRVSSSFKTSSRNHSKFWIRLILILCWRWVYHVCAQISSMVYQVFWTWTLPKIQIFKIEFDPAQNLSIKTARLFEFHDTFSGRVRHCAKWRGVVSASLLRGSCVVDYYWSNTESPATLWWMQFFAAANFSKMSGRRTKVFSKRLKKVKRW